MKKSIMLFIACLLLAIPASAQYYSNGKPIPPRHRTSYRSSSIGFRSPVYAGLRIGMNAATVNSDSPILDATSAKTGLSLGLVTGVQVTPFAPVYFETGLLYSEKGGKSTYNNSKFTYGLNYLEVPLVLKYKIYPSNSNVSIEPFAGGYLACGVGGKIKDYDNRQAYSSFSGDFNDNFKRFDGGLRVGCGVSMNALYLEASYDVGLANVGKLDFDETKTGALNLTVGVNF